MFMLDRDFNIFIKAIHYLILISDNKRGILGNEIKSCIQNLIGMTANQMDRQTQHISQLSVSYSPRASAQENPDFTLCLFISFVCLLDDSWEYVAQCDTVPNTSLQLHHYRIMVVNMSAHSSMHSNVCEVYAMK